MGRNLGSAQCHTTCTKCGEEVTFTYWWDRSVGGEGVEDTEHEAPDGSRCDLSESDVSSTIDTLEPPQPEREDYEDR